MKRIISTLAKSVTLASLVLSGYQAHAIEVSFEEDTSLPIVHLNVAVKAGAVTDPKSYSGLTNFMGEMLLRGTQQRSKEQIDLALDQMGAVLEVETRAEALILRGAVLSSQLDPFLKLVNEIVTQPSFPEAEIRKLKSQVISGILEELGNDQSLAARRFTQFMFHGHPYGNPVLGKTKDIENITRPQLIAHFNMLFRDQNLLVIGTGDAKSSVISTWSKGVKESRGEAEQPIQKVAPAADPESRRMLIVDKPDRTQTQVDIGQIGVRMTDKDFFPLYLGNHAFGGGSFSARLMTEIRVKRGWSYGAYSYFRHGQQPRSWQVHLFPASKYTPEAAAETLRLIGELHDKGISPEEFAFAQQSLVNSAGFMYNTPKKRVENALLERTLDLPDGFMRTYGPSLRKVKQEDVNRSLKEFLKPEKLSITVLGTAKDLKEKLAKAVGIAADKVEVAPYTQE